MTRNRWQELAVVLIILVPLMAVIWLPILTSDIKPWEAGHPVPIEPPEEGRRVYNEAGFAIIAPPTARNRTGMIHLTPKQVFAGRSKAGIVVSRLNEEPQDRRKAKSVEFLGHPAHLKVEQRPSTFDDPPLTTWTYAFQHSGEWFEFSYFIAEAHNEMPGMARSYLETLTIPVMQ
ncbi:MAG TPA: hypothetical protein VM165_19375 [Planctomycetaceae bacterium]|nr:hypothetical protein [Planctomycetaceae bacterium]